jgi:16S rRNA U516 pseudouridylate synthase RsuA-like enzyme
MRAASAASVVPQTPSLLERLRLMGIAAASATHTKESQNRARSLMHVVCPLDINSRGLVICTTSPSLSLLLSSRASTLAKHLGCTDVLLRPLPKPLPTAAVTAASLCASRRSIATRTYKARIGAFALAPHLLAALSSGCYNEGSGLAPIYIEARGAAASLPPPQQHGSKASANVWVEITTTLNGRFLRDALKSRGILCSDLLRTQQGPFTLGEIPAGAALEVSAPPYLLAAADKLAAALSADKTAR